MHRIIDSHCHLTDERLLGQADAVLARARAAGVGPIITVASGSADAEQALVLAARFDDVYAAAAIHPHNAGDCTADKLAEIEWFLTRGRDSGQKIVAVGEIGLDYHYDFAPRDAQRTVFEAQLRMAARLDLPVVIHSRDSIGDALAIIRGVCDAGSSVRGVFHSFTGAAAEAEAVLAAGFFISLSGIVTFKKSVAVQAAARCIPADRLLIETDAPYLSPEPIRNMKVNEPANLVHTLATLASLRGQSQPELAEQTRANTIRLFGLPA